MKKKSTGKSSSTGNKSGKKTTSSKKKKIAEPFISKYPLIDYDKLKEIHEITLSIRLDQGISNFMYDLKIPIETTLMRVKEKINEKHGNACHNIKLFIIENSVKKYMEEFLYKSFKELGIRPGENINLYYEYDPSIHPLLEAGLV